MNALCVGCIWARDAGGVTFCPWVAGSCVKVPGTMEKPDEMRFQLAEAKARGQCMKLADPGRKEEGK